MREPLLESGSSSPTPPLGSSGVTSCVFSGRPTGRALSSTEADRCREQFKLEVGASVAVDWVSTVKRLSAHSGTQEIRKDVEDKGSLLCQGRELRLWERDD